MATQKSSSQSEKMNIIIVGGSISGLMHAIMLRSLGHNVRVLEKQPSSQSDYGAGIGVGIKGKQFLDEFDSTREPLTYACPGMKFVGLNNEVLKLTPPPMHLTSWTALYYRLRGLYDGLSSPFCLGPPQVPSSYGTATFEAEKKVVDVTSESGKQLCLTFEEKDSITPHKAYADLVIDASGPYSLVLSSITGVSPNPRYAGYVAWRGTVPDTRVSDSTNELFDTRFLIFPISADNYCVGYKVPGKGGSSVEPGQRELNWVWYSIIPKPSELEQILTDRDGHLHPNSIPRGKLNHSIWIKRWDAVLPKMNKAFAELMRATEEPFVSKIHENFVSQRSFFNGRLLVVGDGANLMRPNGGQATNHAATQCLALRDVMQGKMTIRQWETLSADEGWQMRLMSNLIASQFLYGKFWGTLAAFHLSFFVRWLKFKAYVKRLVKL